MQIFIKGNEQNILRGTLSYENELSNRSLCFFTVKDFENEKDFQKGNPVTIEENGKTVFSGYIETAKKILLSKPHKYAHQINATDMQYLADKRAIIMLETK